MSNPPIWSPVTWVPFVPWLGVGYLSYDALFSALSSPYRILSVGVYTFIYILASFWQSKTTEIVPEPYLDEIFHIPQAQAYCVGDFHIWDPKLTTPPGLYIFSTVFANLGGIRNCDVFTLRFFNVLVLIATMAYASDCHSLLRKPQSPHPSSARLPLLTLTPMNLHTALNIALFPLLFFFSGLYYTDLLSSCLVLYTFRLFLSRASSIHIYGSGIVSLTMRQTNIFWVAIFLGGLEILRTIRDFRSAAESGPLFDGGGDKEESGLWEQAMREVKHYRNGEIHDVNLGEAGVIDFILCALSIATFILYHPLLILRRLWPYIALLISFASFVFWNGGVVLGDKSNHVATIHLPQLLYLFPFISFMSAPLLIPSIISLLKSILQLILTLLERSSSPKPPTKSTTAAKSTPFTILSHTLNILAATLSLPLTLLIIKYNTIIHPFTLADNRHYIFYVFRYSILAHQAIRYLLAPIYLLCIWLVYQTLAGPRHTGSSSSRKTAKGNFQRDPSGPNTPISTSTSTSTSTLLLLLLPSVLSLITAPLVEPRYFILPWTIFRLQVPSLTPSSPRPPSSRPSTARTAGKKTQQQQPRRKGRAGIWERTRLQLRDQIEGYDWRLYLETAWALLVNAGTAYVFLYRSFKWEGEAAWQRFMW